MDPTPYLEPGFFVDWDHPAVAAWVRDHADPERACRTFCPAVIGLVCNDQGHDDPEQCGQYLEDRDVPPEIALPGPF